MDDVAGPPQRTRDLCLGAAFLAFLYAPLAAFAIHGGATTTYIAENRRPADFPARPQGLAEWGEWPRAFEAWHDDHFGLRRTLIQARSLLAVFVLGVDPSPRFVIGRERWIYSPPVTIELWRGALPFEEDELDAWALALESRRAELARRGIAYRCVIVPSKAEIYPEYLPARFEKGGPSRFRQLSARLADPARGGLLDIGPALTAARADDDLDDRVYFPLGIHWTERGALAGARAIVSDLADELPSIAQVQGAIARTKPVDGIGDSLAVQLYLGDRLRQDVFEVELDPGSRRELAIASDSDLRQVTVDQADPSLPRLLVFHDSFGIALPPLLGRHFSHAVFRWEPDIDFDLVERERPDVVLQVVSDRVLALPPPRVLDVAGDARLRAAFEASTDAVLRFDTTRNSPRVTPLAGGRVFVRDDGDGSRTHCASEAAADTFLLPGFAAPAGKHPIVRLVFESSVAGTAGLFFQTRADPAYSRRRQVRFETHIGRNEVYAEITDPGFSGRLLFRPAEEAGTFAIHALEARCVVD